MESLDFLKSIDYLSFATSFAKWISLFLLVSIVLLIICHKKGLFKREKKVARILVKAYYVFIPLYFIVFAVQYAPVKNTQVQINQAIDDNKQTTTKYIYKFLSSIVSDSLLNRDISAKEIVDKFLTSQAKIAAIVLQSNDRGFIDDYLEVMIKAVESRFLQKILESKFEEKTSGWIPLSEKSSEALYESSFHDLFTEGEIIEILRMEINGYFSSFFKFFFLMFFLGLLIPITEIVLAKVLKY